MLHFVLINKLDKYSKHKTLLMGYPKEGRFASLVVCEAAVYKCTVCIGPCLYYKSLLPFTQVAAYACQYQWQQKQKLGCVVLKSFSHTSLLSVFHVVEMADILYC